MFVRHVHEKTVLDPPLVIEVSLQNQFPGIGNGKPVQILLGADEPEPEVLEREKKTKTAVGKLAVCYRKKVNTALGATYRIDFIDTSRENNTAWRSVLGNARVIILQHESHG